MADLCVSIRVKLFFSRSQCYIVNTGVIGRLCSLIVAPPGHILHS